MLVLQKDIIIKFKKKHANSRKPLDKFIKATENCLPRSHEELKKVFGGVDKWRGRTIIDVGGNKFRVIAVVGYQRGHMTIEHVFTHKQYDHWCDEMR